MGKRIHYDRSGTYTLDNVHSVTPYATTRVIKDPINGEDRKIGAQVGTLHYDSGHTLVTDTDYEELVKKVYNPNETDRGA